MRTVVKTGFLRAAAVVLMVALTGCARQQPMQTPVQPTPAPAAAAPATPEQASGEETPTKESEEAIMQIQIGETTFTAVPAETEAAEALMELLADGPVTIQAENYGGFEKVGSLPQALPQADSRITTRPGDVMLYQGDSIVFFYGANTWAYTRLATIQDASAEELRQAFGGSETSITLSR